MASTPAAPWSDVHTSKRYRLGTIKEDVKGNKYMYVQGVASGAQYAWVTIDEDHVTSLATADAQGRVGILQAALDATTDFGWMAIYGNHYGKALSGFVDNGKVYLTSTGGSIDDSDVAGDFVVGAIGRSALDATGNPSGTAEFELNFPIVQDTAFD